MEEGEEEEEEKEKEKETPSHLPNVLSWRKRRYLWGVEVAVNRNNAKIKNILGEEEEHRVRKRRRTMKVMEEGEEEGGEEGEEEVLKEKGKISQKGKVTTPLWDTSGLI